MVSSYKQNHNAVDDVACLNFVCAKLENVSVNICFTINGMDCGIIYKVDSSAKM